MSGSSEVNLKQTLRKLEYPLCAQEALKKINELLCSKANPNIKNMDLSHALMAEFVFYEVDRRGNKRTTNPSSTVELQLLKILLDILNNNPNETSRNTLFLNLFSPTTSAIRLSTLSRLVSLALGIPCPVVLLTASTWMQQLGNTSLSSCKLAEVLVFDFAHLGLDVEQRLECLPSIASEFTANFLTAVAENYFVANKQYPPDVLLKCVTNWITEHSTLCIAAQRRPPALPPGAIAMEATTPIAGLLRWCVLAPINNQNQEIYSKLYLALLSNVAEIPRSNPPRAINVLHLTLIVPSLSRYYQNLKKYRGDSTIQISNDPMLQLALDRFAQAIQVALSVNAIYGHLDDLFNALNNLPFNKLLSIVVNRYKQNKNAPIIIV